MDNEDIEKKLKVEGASLVGFADLRELPEGPRRGLAYGIVIAVALNPSIVSRIPEGPYLDYYEEYNRVNAQLHTLCASAAAWIAERGFRAVAQLGANAKQDENFRTPLPHKTVATRAGIGWIGKSAVLVTEEYGCAVRLTTALTDMPFETGTPIRESRCGACTQCADHCPGKAIKGTTWRVGIDRDEIVDPFQCKDTVVRRGEPFGLTVATCGLCVAVCPYTKRYLKKSMEQKDCGAVV